MKFIVYLLTLLFVGTAIAQNPTILQGNYITNVFGNSNFVLNPNAQTNTVNVTVSNATVSRSTTTPLVATSEFSVTVTSANGTIAWNTRTFDQGMKGQNCEARFTYRGFQSTSVAQVRQGATVAGANVVARLALTATTDPRIASINFPCGDLSQPTYFVITDTATLSGTHEIGGAYIGLATNMANVAQAEEVGSYTVDGSANCDWTITSATLANFPADADCNTGVVTGLADTSAGKIPGVKFNNLRPGKYLFIASFPTTRTGGVADTTYTVLTDGTTKSNVLFNYINSIVDSYSGATHTLMLEYTTITSPTIQVQGSSGSASTTLRIPNNGSSYRFRITAYRFPSSSELVVTPERQPWYISGNHAGADATLGTSAVTTTTEITNGSLTFTPDSGSQPVATLCSSTNAPPSLSTSATTCAAGNETIGITYNIPSVGIYEVCAQFTHALSLAANGQVDAYFSIQETATNANTALTSYKAINTNAKAPSSALDINFPVNVCSTINYTSVGQKAVRLMYRQGVNGTITTNVTSNSYNDRATYWTVRPVTNQSNSALYVQGPVLASQTGAAIPAGYVGYVQEATRTSDVTLSATAGTYNDVTGLSISLDPGVWEIEAQGQLYVSGAAGVSPNGRIGSWQITDSAGTPNVQREVLCGFTNGVVGTSMTTCRINVRLLVTTTTTYKVRAATVENSTATTNPSVVQLNASTNRVAYIRAVRVN